MASLLRIHLSNRKREIETRSDLSRWLWLVSETRQVENGGLKRGFIFLGNVGQKRRLDFLGGMT